MSCKKTNEEIEKQIQIEQEFADLRFRDMRSSRYGLSPCCPLEKLEKITSRKEICDWDDNKTPVYNNKSYKDHTDTGYEDYRWVFENATIPSWVKKLCEPCTPLSSNVTITTKQMFMTILDANVTTLVDDGYLVRDKGKIYTLAKYDGVISANQTNTYFTVGYVQVPLITGDLSWIVYGNSNAADPKNGADEGEVLTVIIDKYGDGTELYEWTSITGWSPQDFNNTAVHSLSAGTKTKWCTYGISKNCTFCGEKRKEDPDMYFFYDTTSWGLDQVKTAYTEVMEWIEALRQIGAWNGEIYHTIVQGERWLDWAIVPYTGAFNNAGYCGGILSPGLGAAGVIGPQDSSWASGSGGYVDAVMPVTATGVNPANTRFWAVLDWLQNIKGVTAYDSGDGIHTITSTVVGASGLPAKSQGPPPVVQTKELLVVTFLDEAASNIVNQPYHNKKSCSAGSCAPTAVDASGGDNGSKEEPTPCWIADYNKFKTKHEEHLAISTDHKASYFMYPSYPDSVSHASFPLPLQVLMAVSSGDNGTDGLLATPPTNALLGSGGLDAIKTKNPYAANYGKLDTMGWGCDVTEPAGGFTKEHFVASLEAFWEPGAEECYNDPECISIYVKDDQGNPIECYPIYIDNREVGMTDKNGFYLHTEYFASVNTKHSIDICHCFTTTGACNQQRIDITVTPETAKVVCTKLTVDCTPET